MKITLRSATPDDYDFLWHLHITTFKSYVTQIWGWDEVQQIAMFAERFNPQQIQIIQLIAQDVGRLDIDYRDDEVFLSLIAISPDYQGQGIGSHLIRNLIQQAHADHKPLTLRVLRPNPAQHPYQRLGFEVVKEDDIRLWMICRP